MTKKRKASKTLAVAKCLWGHLCTLSSIDSQRNNISLFNMIDQINVPRAAFEHQSKENKPIFISMHHELVLHWVRTLDIEGINDELTFDFKVKVIDPKGMIIQESLATTKFPKEMRRMRYRLSHNAVIITTAGNYFYEIEVKKDNDVFERTCVIPLEVRIRD